MRSILISQDVRSIMGNRLTNHAISIISSIILTSTFVNESFRKWRTIYMNFVMLKCNINALNIRGNAASKSSSIHWAVFATASPCQLDSSFACASCIYPGRSYFNYIPFFIFFFLLSPKYYLIICLQIRIHVYMYVYAHRETYIHTYTYTYIYTYTYMCIYTIHGILRSI